MFLDILKSKIHEARLTGSLLRYEGSIAIDQDLMDQVGIRPYERVLVVNASNGERLQTYAIPGPRGAREVVLNGAAARRGCAGDIVTIMSFAGMTPEEAAKHRPKVAVLDENNHILRTRNMDA